MWIKCDYHADACNFDRIDIVEYMYFDFYYHTFTSLMCSLLFVYAFFDHGTDTSVGCILHRGRQNLLLKDDTVPPLSATALEDDSFLYDPMSTNMLR